jgi:hypothetical protein
MLVGDKSVDGLLISDLKNGSEKKVILICNDCGKKTQTTYHNYINGQKRNGNTGKTNCRRCASIKSGKKRIGKPCWNKGIKLPDNKKGKYHSSWRGGKYIDAHGYVMVHCPSGKNRKSKWADYKKEHVLVIEKSIDRKLEDKELIHHIDGDKQNNFLHNLALLSCHKEHKDAHQSLQKIGYWLIKNKLIHF